MEQAGEFQFERYFRGGTPNSRVDVRSVGKSITALAVGIAVDEGELESIDLKAWDLVTDGQAVPNDDQLKRNISIRDLLSMSSALACDDWVSTSPGNEERMYRQRDWTAFALAIPTDPNYRRDSSGQGRFSYCTAGVFLLGRIIERATGQRFDTYVQERLFDRLDIPGADWRLSPSGEVQSGGQIGMRARDLAKIARLVMDAGKRADDQIVSVDWLRLMLTPKVGVSPEQDYSFLWWSQFFEAGPVDRLAGAFMLGNGGNIVLLLPDIDAVIIIQATNYREPDAFETSVAIVEDHILPELLGAD